MQTQNKSMQEKCCENCKHSKCRVCSECHNIDCDLTFEPHKSCYNSLLPSLNPSPKNVRIVTQIKKGDKDGFWVEHVLKLIDSVLDKQPKVKRKK